MSFKQLNWLLLAVCVSLPLGAQQNSDVFQMDIPVGSQSAQDRQRALSNGMRELLQGLTRTAGVNTEPGVARALRTPERYVTSYRYFYGTEAVNADRLFLAVNYDPQLIQNLVRDNGLPLWLNGQQLGGGGAQLLDIDIVGVRDFTQYSRALRHLQSLPLVRSAEVLAVQAGVLSLRLDLNGSDTQLDDALAAQNELLPASRASASSEFFPSRPQYELR